uniref:Uncharacterized protein n=1 Tax=Anopheles atroparvus TaxID=41427 RepID=A0AAG5DI32_ANOAO
MITKRSHINQLRACPEPDEGWTPHGNKDQLPLDVLLDEFNLPQPDRIDSRNQPGDERTSQQTGPVRSNPQPGPSQIPIRQRTSYGRIIRLPARFQPYVLS